MVDDKIYFWTAPDKLGHFGELRMKKAKVERKVEFRKQLYAHYEIVG